VAREYVERVLDVWTAEGASTLPAWSRQPGMAYTVDLSAKNEASLRQVLGPTFEVATRVRDERGRGRGRGATAANDRAALYEAAGLEIHEAPKTRGRGAL
jgi:hypothetical protein